MGFKIDDIVHPDSKIIARQLECSVCLCIVDKPVQTTCSHIFCASCVDQSLACPTCRAQFTPGDRKPLQECNLPLLRMLNAVHVWCPYQFARFSSDDVDSPKASQAASAAADAPTQDEDPELAVPAAKRPRLGSVSVQCDWTGSYGDLLSKHLEECPHHIVVCPNRCGQSLARKDLKVHELVCVKHLEVCSICGELVKPDAMPKHLEEQAQAHVKILQVQLQELKSQPPKPNNVIDGANRAVVWEMTDVAEMLKKFPKGSMRKSSEFSFGAIGPFHLNYYPNGRTDRTRGSAAFCVIGPAWVVASLEITIDGIVKELSLNCFAETKGWEKLFPVPDSSAKRVHVTVELKAGFRKLSTV